MVQITLSSKCKKTQNEKKYLQVFGKNYSSIAKKHKQSKSKMGKGFKPVFHQRRSTNDQKANDWDAQNQELK